MGLIPGFLKRKVQNLFNQAFFKYIGGGYTAYDTDGHTYIDKGYKINPFVYTFISQMATKTASIPRYVKKIEDKNALQSLKTLKRATSNNLSIQQKSRQFQLESKAYGDEIVEFFTEKPNPNQTWE